MTLDVLTPDAGKGVSEGISLIEMPLHRILWSFSAHDLTFSVENAVFDT